MTDERPAISPDINPMIGAMLRSASAFLTHEHSLFRSLGLKPLLIGPGKARFSMDLPSAFDDGTGMVHGGLVTIILDSIFGLTVFTSLDVVKPIATINLRTDYLMPASCGDRAVCDCECVAVDLDVAHVTGSLTRESDGRLIATGVGAFMIGTRGPLKPGPSAGSRI